MSAYCQICGTVIEEDDGRPCPDCATKLKEARADVAAGRVTDASEVFAEIEEQDHGTSRLFQIHEHDLAELERLLPKVFDRVLFSGPDGKTDPAMRVAFKTVQTIITNIRWDYGPPMEVYRVPA